MRPFATRWYIHALRWPHLMMELLLASLLILLFIAPSVSAAMRLQDRSLYMNDSQAGATTFYRISFRYMSDIPVGSYELLFCNDPIPYNPCVTPSGLDVSGAELIDQSGETGFSITAKSTNRLLMSRSSALPTDNRSFYTFDHMINPSDIDYAFSIRIKTFSSSDGSGPQTDFGSIRGQVTEAIEIETQVPPMLIFCLAETVELDCANVSENNYSDMGELGPTSTLSAQSQMAVGTNASAGFAITVNGASMSAGTNVIKPLSTPTPSQVGRNQFGINLVANASPAVGEDPEGVWANAVATAEYGQADYYTFNPGDVVAHSPNVSLMKKFTVSYIVNSSPSLKAGVYTTTINFIASGRF